MQILYTARFIRSLKKLPEEIQEGALEALQIFEHDPKHPLLKTHKLVGKWSGYHAISLDFHYRIILKTGKGVTYCMDIGTHDIYK